MALPNDPPNAPTLRRSDSAVTAVLLIMMLGAAVAIALGVYGQLHEPTGFALNIAGFSGPQAVKAWLAPGAFLLALVQLASGWR